MVLLAVDFAHEQLEVVDVKLTLHQLVFRRRVLPPRHLAHVLLAAGLAAALLALFDLHFVVALSCGEHFLERPPGFSLPEGADVVGEIEGPFDEGFEGVEFGFGGEDEFSPLLVVDESDGPVHVVWQSIDNCKGVIGKMGSLKTQYHFLFFSLASTNLLPCRCCPLLPIVFSSSLIFPFPRVILYFNTNLLSAGSTAPPQSVSASPTATLPTSTPTTATTLRSTAGRTAGDPAPTPDGTTGSTR